MLVDGSFIINAVQRYSIVDAIINLGWPLTAKF